MKISLRVVLAVVGGYALTALFSAGLALGLAKAGILQRGDAVLLAAMLAFVVYPCCVIAAFVVRRRQSTSLRSAFAWLHTWAGLALGSVLFSMFFMGTLSVFDRELDRWMMPETRLPPPPAAEEISLDRTLRSAVAQLAPGADTYSAVLPTARVPTLQVRYLDAATKERVLRHVDPRSGELLEPTGTHGATGFIYPFHYGLNLEWAHLGIWIAGLAATAMLILVVSGVVIHRRLFQDFFVFRPQGRAIRSTLDLHNVTGVLALPFHFVITLSGLIIFFSLYFPGTFRAVYGSDEAAFRQEVFGIFERPKSGAPGQLGSLDTMARDARTQWQGGSLSFVQVRNPGDAAGYVQMSRSYAHRVTVTPDPIAFDAMSGRVLQRAEPHPVERVQRFVSGMHRVQFDSWALRFLYFAAGLTGCVLIATGFLYWMEARRAKHAQDSAGFRVVHALTIGSVSGIVVATLGYFVANRSLPSHAHLGSIDREHLEIWLFFAIWLLTFVHAAQRSGRAWAEQCTAIALLALTAPVLNWATTGDHPLRGSPAVACVDLALLCTAGLAALAARRLQRRDVPSRVAREPHLETAHG